MNKSSEMVESPSAGESAASSGPASKKGISIKEEIIYATEVLEEEEEEVEEVEEIVEIIEEIEEIEEIVEEEEDEIVEERSAAVSGRRPVETREAREVDEDSHGDSAGDEEPAPRFKSANRHPKSAHRRSYERKKKAVAYDADEDWEEEDGEQQQIAALRAKRLGKNNSVETPPTKNNHSLNGKRSANSRGSEEYSSSAGRSNAEPAYKASKTRPTGDYSSSRRANDSTGINEIEREDDEEEDEEDDDNQHEIVKSAENNLVYTVLGSKKSNQTSQPRSKKDASQNPESGRYMKVGIRLSFIHLSFVFSF